MSEMLGSAFRGGDKLPPRWRILYSFCALIIFGLLCIAIPINVQLWRNGEVNWFGLHIPRTPTLAERNCSGMRETLSRLSQSVTSLIDMYDQEDAKRAELTRQYIASFDQPNVPSNELQRKMLDQEAVVKKYNEQLKPAVSKLETQVADAFSKCGFGEALNKISSH